VRKDSPHPLIDGPDGPPTRSRPAPTRSRVARAVPAMVGGLVLATGAAVASVSWWLVPPYLALMGFLLIEPAGRRVNATNPAGPESASTGGTIPPDDAPDPVDDASIDGDPDPDLRTPGGSPRGEARSDATATARSRRGTGKGRGRKSRTAAEPSPATWVRVAPGKFVRVEPGEFLAGAGPHPPQAGDAPGPTATTPEAGAAPPVDQPGRPDAEPGPHDHPQEDALDAPHPGSTPPPGPWPGGPRDLDLADDGPPVEGDPLADPGPIGRDLDVSDPDLDRDEDLDPPEASDVAGFGVSRAVDEAGAMAAWGDSPSPPEPGPTGEPGPFDAPAEDARRPDRADEPAGTAATVAEGEGHRPDPEDDPATAARADDPTGWHGRGEPESEPDPDPEGFDDEREDEGDEPETYAASLDPEGEDDGPWIRPGADPSDPAEAIAAPPSPGVMPEDEDPRDGRRDEGRDGTEVEDDGRDDDDGEPETGRPRAASGPSRTVGGPAHPAGSVVPPLRRNVRTARADRRPAGYRRRSKRGDGRRHHPARTFPPRSPPARRPSARGSRRDERWGAPPVWPGAGPAFVPAQPPGRPSRTSP